MLVVLKLRTAYTMFINIVQMNAYAVGRIRMTSPHGDSL